MENGHLFFSFISPHLRKVERVIANGVIHRTIRFADEVYNEPPRVLIFQEAEAECPDDEHLEIQNLPILNGTLPNYHLPKGEHSICKCF